MPQEVPVLTLYYDYPSPAAAVAVLRLQRLADEGAAIAFEGLDVLGVEVALPVTLDQHEELRRYRDRAAELGLDLRRPSRRPPTLAAHLVGRLATEAGLGASWREVCLRGYWTGNADLGDEAVLRALAGEAGLDMAAVDALLQERAERARLRQRMVVLRSRGIGGVPVVEVAGGTFVSADLPDEDLRQLAAL